MEGVQHLGTRSKSCDLVENLNLLNGEQRFPTIDVCNCCSEPAFHMGVVGGATIVVVAVTIVGCVVAVGVQSMDPVENLDVINCRADSNHELRNFACRLAIARHCTQRQTSNCYKG